MWLSYAGLIITRFKSVSPIYLFIPPPPPPNFIPIFLICPLFSLFFPKKILNFLTQKGECCSMPFFPPRILFFFFFFLVLTITPGYDKTSIILSFVFSGMHCSTRLTKDNPALQETFTDEGCRSKNQSIFT